MKPLFSILKDNHYSSNPSSSSYKSAEDVYNEIGYDYAKLVEENPAYVNTCAVRMSLALLKSGVVLTKGSLRIKAGTYKDKCVHTGAKVLADELVNIFGNQKWYTNIAKAETELLSKKG